MSRYSFKKIARALGVVVLSAIEIGFGGRGAIAQNVIIPDNTLGSESSVVIPLGPTVDLVLGGAERGNNLFHSFEQFDVGNTAAAYFLIGSGAIDNIFARISTEDISEVFGVLGIRQLAGGNFLSTPANLYLINPNGIVFGENAFLDIGGSFSVTTADNITFTDGRLFGSTTSAPLPNALTVSPSAYLFSGQNIGEIKVTSTRIGLNGIDQGLTVPLRENLNLVSGNILVDGLGVAFGAGLSARGGQLNIIAVREGRVNILANETLSPLQGNTNGDINFVNNALLSTELDNGGNIFLVGQNVQFVDSVVRSGILRGVGTQNSQAGNILITANTLSLTDGAQIDSSIAGIGNAGNIEIEAQRVTLTGSSIEGANTPTPREEISAIRSTVSDTATGSGGTISIRSPRVEISGGAGITASTLGTGKAGNISIVTDSFLLSGTTSESLQPSSIMSTVEPSATGNGGNIDVIANDAILIENGAGLTASAFGIGRAGIIQLSSENRIVFRGQNRAGVGSTANARVGNNAISIIPNMSGERSNAITVKAGNELRLEDGAQINAGTSNSADSGNISITAPNITITGATAMSNLARYPSGVFTTTENGSSGRGGDIEISTSSFLIEEGGVLTSRSLGEGLAGNIFLNADNQILVRDSDIDTISAQTSGGDVTIKTRVLRLEGDGDIITRSVEGRGSGGSIDITATAFIIALDDSDIIASASQGRGGNITLRTPGFFGENFTIASLNADPDGLDSNSRVDINATGSVSGIVTVPDVSFLENSLTSLSDTLITPDTLIANSCIARAENGQGTLVTTGGSGLASAPNSELAVPLSTGDVQAIPSPTTISNEGHPQNAEISIEEPTGIYQLANGRLVMSQECL
jgi:filamentous hemagglutinin family protein